MKLNKIIIIPLVCILLIGLGLFLFIFFKTVSFLKIENESKTFSITTGNPFPIYQLIDSMLLKKREYYLPEQKEGAKIKNIIVRTVSDVQWFSVEKNPKEDLSLVSSSSKIESGNLIISVNIKPEAFQLLSKSELTHTVNFNIFYQLSLTAFTHDYGKINSEVINKGLQKFEKTKFISPLVIREL